MRKIWVQSLGRENPLEKEMTSHSSILARATVHGIAELHMVDLPSLSFFPSTFKGQR